MFDYSTCRAWFDYMIALIHNSWASSEEKERLVQALYEFADNVHKQGQLDKLIEINQK